METEVFAELESASEKAIEALRRELARLRTGRANASLLDNIRVEYYGALTPLKQVASISVPEPRMLSVKPFDRALIKAIERAVTESEFGLNPQNDGEIIRIPLPMLTEERRKDLVKLARKFGEEAKIAIRKARHDARNVLDALQKDSSLSEDECERAKKRVDEAIQSGTAKVDEVVAAKEKDILVV